jgi:hypothetical protein
VAADIKPRWFFGAVGVFLEPIMTGG